MRDDYSDFLEFSKRYGEKLANDMVQRICECHYAREYNSDPDIDFWKIDSAGDGLNYTLHGTINHGARCWEFEIEDGNNNGTVIHGWERGWKHGGWPVPAQSAWLLAPLRVIIVRYIIDRLEPVMLDGFNKLMEAAMKSRILAIGDPLEVKFPTQDGAIWRAATTVACTPEKISVAYSDGTRQDIQNVYFERYRIPEKRAHERPDILL